MTTIPGVDGAEAPDRKVYGVDEVPEFLSPSRLDDVARIVTQLSSEVWVLRDRLRTLEYRLGEAGAVPAVDVDARPPAPLREELAADRSAFVQRVFGAPSSLRRRMELAAARRRNRT